MTSFRDFHKACSAFLFEVEWLPDDSNWPLEKLKKSYVVAMTMDEAARKVSANPIDSVSVRRLGEVLLEPVKRDD